MNHFYQLNPSIPLMTPKGEAEAIAVLDYSKEDNLKFKDGTDYEQVWAADAERILALIALVRKKDEKINHIKEKTVTDPAEGPELRARASIVHREAIEALALTEELK